MSLAAESGSAVLFMKAELCVRACVRVYVCVSFQILAFIL